MRRHRHLYPASLSALTGLALLAPAAYAQQPGQGPYGVPANQAGTNFSAAGAGSQGGTATGGGIQLKLMDMLIIARPSIKLDMQHSDNIYSTPNDTVSDRILMLTPALELGAKQGANSYRLRLSSVIGQYQNNRSENYTNTTLGGQADLNLGTHLRARVDGEYIDGVDPRGSTNNALTSTPDRYHQTRGVGVVSLGAMTARGRVDLELGQTRRNYVNNRASTAGADRVTDDLGATFYWRIGPKTTLLFQGKHSIVDYSLAASTLASVENTFQFGAQWDATAKTSGTFRLGMTRKDFDDPARLDETRLSWTGAARWSPRTYSHVDLSLTRAPAETSGGVGNFIDRNSAALRWSHAWSTKFTTEASANYSADAYQGAPRTDHLLGYGARATYRMRRWLSFGADYARSERSSSDSNFDYRRNAIMLFVQASL